jgi:hypothetical protein
MAEPTPAEIKAASAAGIEKAEQIEDTDLRADLEREMRERGQ